MRAVLVAGEVTVQATLPVLGVEVMSVDQVPVRLISTRMEALAGMLLVQVMTRAEPTPQLTAEAGEAMLICAAAAVYVASTVRELFEASRPTTRTRPCVVAVAGVHAHERAAPASALQTAV